ncbi:cyclin-dependent protein kinase inhibitor SMR14 [Argentina anserina]|uniref:cyclin-dependent protein kinase inhibitor SMR14 n=1 Tax=Argentina anserina TaxID=57926 RepID=UPI00217631E3|nr:cyclin-dependent protein kinase inhibitor SMR14 [Potentilla anserina]
MYSAEFYKDSVSSFMVGYCDSKAAQMLVSDKDDGGALNLNPLEFKLFVQEFKDRKNCQVKRNNSNRDESDDKEDDRNRSEVHQQKEEEQVMKSSEEKQEDNFDMFVSSLKVKIPSAEESRGLEDEDEGLKTPTSLDQKIIVSLKSPPGAPRKPKALPLKKRKAHRQPRLLLDLSREIELLFPPVVCADLGGDTIKKKSRQESS